jgi:hypothetical protein
VRVTPAAEGLRPIASAPAARLKRPAASFEEDPQLQRGRRAS